MRQSIQWVLILCLLLLGISSVGRATTFNVSNGAQLQAALDTAQSNNQGDTIILAPGNYDASGATFTYPSNPGAAAAENFPLTIQGSDPTTTLLDGGTANQVMNIDMSVLTTDTNAAVVIQGLTFQHGNDTAKSGGGGLRVFSHDAEITVNNSQFLSNNSGVFGGGV